MPEESNIECNKKSLDFFEFLRAEGLYYSKEVVENFLLSLKAKQFLILSGTSGTGKTKLAQAYGKFISKRPSENKVVDFEVTLNKADTNGGFTLNSNDFFGNLPYDGRKADGIYKVRIGELETECSISLTPRFWYRPNKDKVVNELVRLKNEGKNKEILQVYMPQNKSSGDNYEVVPVGSNWTESRFIVGYKNALTGKYCSTRSLDLIIKSNNSSVEPYLLILDEMNLSHVERYFSDILSAMESKEKIPIDADDTVPDSIDIGDNLFIIGTVNVDETTYTFSPKVLDRANVIEFDPLSIDDYVSLSTDETVPEGDVDYLQNCMCGTNVRSMNAISIISEMRDVVENKSILDEIIADVNSLQRIMDSINLSFGFRTMDEIMRFLYVAWIYKGKGKFDTWVRFFDAQIKQKILPKIHGNLSIKDGLKDMKDLCDSKGYVSSATKLSKMIDILEKQRYVSFNN